MRDKFKTYVRRKEKNYNLVAVVIIDSFLPRTSDNTHCKNRRELEFNTLIPRNPLNKFKKKKKKNEDSKTLVQEKFVVRHTVVTPSFHPNNHPIGINHDRSAIRYIHFHACYIISYLPNP